MSEVTPGPRMHHVELGKVGDRVRAVHFHETANGFINDNDRVPPGTEGTVTFIDSTGTRHVTWDNDVRIGLLPDRDEWQVVEERS